MVAMPDRHRGKVAIVTGGGQGIGKGIATRLVQEGATVVIADNEEERAMQTSAELDQLTGSAVPHRVDIGDVNQIQSMIDTIVEQYGKIDILVNNAVFCIPFRYLRLHRKSGDWLQRVNQRGLFFCLQRVAMQMVKQVPERVKEAGQAERAFAQIVNISSVAGRSGRPFAAHYSAAKWAVISITQSAAEYLAPYGINVNAICPGIVETPMWDEIDRTQSERFGLERGTWIKKSADELVPLKRVARATEDIGAAVSFLCSDDAEYITGQTINVSGGLEMN